MNEKDAFRLARKFYNLPKFERNCRIAQEGSRLKKAYRIPGTREHGDYSMLREQVRNFAKKLVSN